MAPSLSTFRTIIRTLVGVWLGLWTISGVAMGTGGILILAVECYGWLSLGLWLSVTPIGILRRLAIVIPAVPWTPLQSLIDSLLHLPMSGVFIWCGFNIAAMAWITRKRLERRISLPPNVIPARQARFGNFGINELHIQSEE